jgi:hypothetical protein
MVCFLLALLYLSVLGVVYLFGVIVVGGLLFYEHSLVGPGDLSNVNKAFFNINGLISKKKNISSIESEIQRILNLNFFYKLRNGAIKQAIDSNKKFLVFF